jgi:uncharacterized protein YecE (DUF72 family)
VRGRARIGTSGYQYDHWRGVFYPGELPRQRWFEHYARHFDVVEINTTFYGLPSAATFEAWRDAAPDGFLYALKFSRYGSHMKCLKSPAAAIGKFMRPASRLKDHLGPILVQLKPHWAVDVGRLRGFLERTDGTRWAVEFRDRTWLCAEVFDLLREHNAALCIHDMLDDHPYEITADWVYLRFHGDHYHDGYSRGFLAAQADRIAGHLAVGLDVFAFFNNDAEGQAVRNALDLKAYVSARRP